MNDDLWEYFGVVSKPQKCPWVRDEYEQRKCAYPGCEQHPSFGYGMPFCEQQTWTCREHQTWFEETQGKPRTDPPPGQLDLGIEDIMQSVRQRYAETVQPRVRAYAEARQGAQ